MGIRPVFDVMKGLPTGAGLDCEVIERQGGLGQNFPKLLLGDWQTICGHNANGGSLIVERNKPNPALWDRDDQLNISFERGSYAPSAADIAPGRGGFEVFDGAGQPKVFTKHRSGSGGVDNDVCVKHRGVAMVVDNVHAHHPALVHHRCFGF